MQIWLVTGESYARYLYLFKFYGPALVRKHLSHPLQTEPRNFFSSFFLKIARNNRRNIFQSIFRTDCFTLTRWRKRRGEERESFGFFFSLLRASLVRRLICSEVSAVGTQWKRGGNTVRGDGEIILRPSRSKAKTAQRNIISLADDSGNTLALPNSPGEFLALQTEAGQIASRLLIRTK